MKNLNKMKMVVLLVLIAMLTACGGGTSAAEKAAVSFVTDFMNEQDADKKKKYVEDHVMEEAKPLFTLLAAAGTSSDQYKNPKAVESVDFNEDGQKGSMVLIQADEGKEAAVVVVDGKIMIGFGSINNGEPNKQFEEVRKKFKEALPK